MTGGSVPEACSAIAVLTLSSLASATAAMVEPGPTGVSSPAIATSASPGGVQRSSTTSAWSSRRVPDECPDLLWRDASTAREHLSRSLTPEGRPYDLFAEALEVLAEGGMHVTAA